MAKYLVRVPVIAVEGHQTFSVEADSEDEAIAEWIENGGEFHSEEIEVMDLDDEHVEAQLDDECSANEAREGTTP